MFAGIMARPLATSLRTNSGVISLGMEAHQTLPPHAGDKESS